MPTQEERIAALEQTMSEYRPAMQNFAVEVSMVKGLIITQTEITQGLRTDMSDVKKRLDIIENHLETVEQRLNDHVTALNMLNQCIDRLETKYDKHTATLDKHTAMLNMLNQHLNEHTTLLTQILARLPKQEL